MVRDLFLRGRRPSSLSVKAWAVMTSALSVAMAAPFVLAPGAAQAQTPAAKGSGDAEIVVTARKKKESVIDVPESITAFSGETLQKMNIQSFNDYATKVPDLSFAYGAGSWGFADSRTIAIRGLSGAGTTAVYIDDTAVTGSMDPRVVDVERIEVLKGPQGTLFGEGSLGGTVRMVTVKPKFTEDSLAYGAQAGAVSHGGSPDYGFNAIGNVIAVPDKLAFRFVGYVNHDGGFITRTYPNASGGTSAATDQGAQISGGFSASGLLKINPDLDALFRLIAQEQYDHGLPDAYVPMEPTTPGAPVLPFKPISYTLDREYNIQEKVSDRWILPSVQLNGHYGDWDLVSATSYFARNARELEDGSEGTATASQWYFGYTPQPVAEAWPQLNSVSRFTQEFRGSFSYGALSGTVGAYFSKTRQLNHLGPYYMPNLAATYAAQGLGTYTGTTDLGWNDNISTLTTSKALFGELYYKFWDKFTLTLGARQYWLQEKYAYWADGLFNGGFLGPDPIHNSQSGISPKAALEYKVDPDSSVYASASKGFRAGGGNNPLPSFCNADLAALGTTNEAARTYGSDDVWNYELGGKTQIAHNVLVTAAVYEVEWNNIQQPIYLPDCGLTYTANAGHAVSQGAEFEVSGRVAPGLDLRFGAGYDEADITKKFAPTEFPGKRVRQTPKWTATTSATYTRKVSASLDGFVEGDVSYVGDSVSSTANASLAFVRPAYTLVNGRLGVRWGGDELSLYGKNLGNARANLGDINPISYVRQTLDVATDTQTGIQPRVAVSRPLEMGVAFRHSF